MSKIILIRHAEKNHRKIHLSDIGMIRALHLLEYFTFDFEGVTSPIHSVFAQKQHRSHSSNRCVETVDPLCRFLHIHPDNTFLKKETKELVRKINSNRTGTILVCWEHNELPKIAYRLGLIKGLHWNLNPFIPADHHRDHFDITWVIDRYLGRPRLRTFKQFEIFNHKPVYTFPTKSPIFSYVFDNSVLERSKGQTH